MSMLRGNDQEWLSGNPIWWPNSEENDKLFRFGEEIPTESWDSTTYDIGGRGWMRQRLEPVGPRILFPTAWSLFFLIASTIPLIFPNKVFVDDQNLAISFFLISWFLLLVPFLQFSNGNSEDFNLFPLQIIPFILGIFLFLLHIAIDPKLGWLSYLFFIFAWFKTVQNISKSLSVNSARWLLPILQSDFSEDIFNDGWILLSKKFRNGLIAKWSKELGPYSGEITGLSWGNHKFIAFSVVYNNRIIHDPFNSNFLENDLLKDILFQSPVKILGESWPLNFIQIAEDE